MRRGNARAGGAGASGERVLLPRTPPNSPTRLRSTYRLRVSTAAVADVINEVRYREPVAQFKVKTYRSTRPVRFRAESSPPALFRFAITRQRSLRRVDMITDQSDISSDAAFHLRAVFLRRNKDLSSAASADTNIFFLSDLMENTRLKYMVLTSPRWSREGPELLTAVLACRLCVGYIRDPLLNVPSKWYYLRGME
ncbi:hypothetical protein EVAR_21860_1 [Eumeta japonica]|uniref:Uncharacterized protein n=1 Tax=Eumeta variegata TaxID=151549 RepID=A0A4C1V8H5_EUMVA|nr:hypothetical protein EVAR_21860_1 [Eumeta japonica]